MDTNGNDRGRMYNNLKSQMSMLFTMSRSLSSSIDLDVLLNLILEKARLLLKAKFCMLKLLDKPRKRLLLASSAGFESGTNTAAVSRFENGLSRQIMDEGASFIINDINEYFKKDIPACLGRNRIRSMAMMPLFSNRRKVGMLSAYVPYGKDITKEDVDMFEMVASLCAMAIDNATMLERIRKDYLNTVKTLAKIIDANDPCTKGHCDKVMRYSLAISRKMRLGPRDENAIKTASLLHDIGKVGIDLQIIRKRGPLTPEDWRQVHMHPEIGARIIAQVGFLDDVAPIIKHHHERFAGGGYPEPDRKGERIPVGARVLAVADAFDAMTSSRPYKKAMTKKEAIAELKRCAGTQFDPKIVGAFIGAGIR